MPSEAARHCGDLAESQRGLSLPQGHGAVTAAQQPKETVAVYYENHRKYTNARRGQDAGLCVFQQKLWVLSALAADITASESRLSRTAIFNLGHAKTSYGICRNEKNHHKHRV
jgi:hypothetical protein